MIEMNFAESVEYLYSLGNEVETMKLGLENIRNLLTALGNPQNNYLKVQVAGTNGKGSVCAFLDTICVSAGVRTGLYTSPHLISITERIRINGRYINEEDFARIATHIRATAEKLLADGTLEYRPTFFEQVTATALVAFTEAKVELAILETGLGGRLDATTAANAEIAAITSIDLDHQEYLGETLAEIASEKAAIIHEDSTVVIGDQPDEVMSFIIDRCRRLNIVPITGSEPEAWVIDPQDGSEVVTFNSTLAIYRDVNLGLRGRHQIENARVAVLLAAALLYQFGFDIADENVLDGLERARHPGRLEFSGRYLFDGAHNIAGAKALAAYLDESVDRPITLIFGAMKDKPIAEIAEILFPKADKIILTRPDNSRAMTPEEIAPFVRDTFDQKDIFLTAKVGEALAKANDITDENGLILVTGSLYLIGESKKLIKDNPKFEI